MATYKITSEVQKLETREITLPAFYSGFGIMYQAYYAVDPEPGQEVKYVKSVFITDTFLHITLIDIAKSFAEMEKEREVITEADFEAGYRICHELCSFEKMQLSDDDRLLNFLQYQWLHNGYPVELVRSVVDYIESKSVDQDEDQLIIPDVAFLKCVAKYSSARNLYFNGDPENWHYKQLAKDIETGVTFGFWIKDGQLHWER